jgi:hypothetical protein
VSVYKYKDGRGYGEDCKRISRCDRGHTMSEYGGDRTAHITDTPNSKSKAALTSDVVTNLSSYELSASERTLLSKGLKFIPDRTKLDSTQLLADLGEWERRMRLRDFYHEQTKEADGTGSDDDPAGIVKVKRKSHFTPNKGTDSWLDLYIDLVKTDVVRSLRKAGTLNITKDENAAFMSLLHNESILIRPADKVSGIVLVDKTEYIAQLRRAQF